MKTKKLPLLIILLAGLMIPTLESCKKYTDGPFISFRSRTERVAHAWKVGSYTLNGTDLTGTMTGYTETYTKDGNYSYSWYILGGTSKWSFQDSDKEIQLNDIGRISIKTTKPLYFDSYRKNRHTGSLILIDEATNETVGAGMII